MQEIGDLILNYGLGAAAIAAITYIAVKLINYTTKDMSGKVDSLYELIQKQIEINNKIIDEIRRK